MNRRMASVGRDIKDHPVPTPGHGLAAPHQIRLPRTPSSDGALALDPPGMEQLQLLFSYVEQIQWVAHNHGACGLSSCYERDSSPLCVTDRSGALLMQ